MWYIHTIKCYSALEKGNPAIYDNMDEPRRHYAKRNMPVTGGRTLYDSTCTRYLKWSKAWKQKIEWCLPELGGGAGKTGNFCSIGIKFQFFRMNKP